jgi:hypothetical protein
VKIKAFNLILIIMFLCVSVLAADSNTTGQNTNTLAWETIAEKFNRKEPFYTAKSEDADNINYALDPNASIIKENNNFYAIVTADWKKDLLAWCKKNKEQIETNPDPQLIYSSIAVSHFDNLMELAGKSSILSENILSALAKAVTAKGAFEKSNCPDIVRGLNKIRLKRFEGSLIEEFVVFVPETYNDSNAHAVYLYPDNRRSGARDNYLSRSGLDNYLSHSGLIDIWWHTVSDKDINWKNFQYFFEILKQKLMVDEDRIYVNGDCGNGLATMSLALNFPDQWAECSISLGNTYRHLAGNAFNLPLIFVLGDNTVDDVVGYYDFAVECFKYHGCRFFKHSKPLNTAQVRGVFVPTEIRDLSPYRVSYTIESLANPKAYWTQIDGREDENFIASIDAIVWGQNILVKTDNVDAYALNLELAPLDCNRPVEIIENGKHIDFVTGAVFTRKSSKYENALYIKNKSLNGPVADIFTDQYVVAWEGDEIKEGFARQLAGSGPCFADVNLPADFLDTHNIVFVGRFEKSKYFKEIAEKLPVIIETGKLITHGRVYEGDLGVIFIYPNPLNPKKYIAVFSGTSDKALNLLNMAWGQIKSRQTADIGIFEAADNNQVKWLRTEKFDTVWGWHKSWNVPLAKLAKTYPEWKWRQWVARVLREQLDADVMISENPFLSEELPDKGELTLRDVSRIFKNDWIVKVSLKGKDLRELLTVSFNDISSKEVSALIVEGISLVKQPANSDVLCINELDNDKLYTVALSYKAINGKRMGMVMKNYRLESEGFPVLLLKQYLTKKSGIDLDAELDSIQLNIF